MAHSNGDYELLPLETRIAIRAHQRWVRRGCPAGDGLEDWYAARAEIEVEEDRDAYQRKVALYE